MNTGRIREIIRANAAEIVRLHSRIHTTFKRRNDSPEARTEWENACAEFHKRYDGLAFAGGYDGQRGHNGALERITSGDPEAMEAAICFLEERPYFFRSGYMFKAILRRCGRAPLSPDQMVRLEAVKSSLADWKRQKNSN